MDKSNMVDRGRDPGLIEFPWRSWANASKGQPKECSDSVLSHPLSWTGTEVHCSLGIDEIKTLDVMLMLPSE